MTSQRPPLAACLLYTTVLCLALAASSRAEDKPTPSPASTPAVAPAAEPTAEAAASPAVAASPAPDIAAEVAGLKTADALWEYIKKWSDLSDLENLDPNLDPEAKMNAAKEMIHVKVTHLRPAVDAFLAKYPQDPRHWSVTLMRVLFLRGEENIPDEEVTKTLRQVAAAPDAPADAKKQARGALLQDTLEKSDPAAGLTEPLEKELIAYEKDFPDDPSGADFVTLRLHLLKTTAPDKIDAELTTLSKSPNKATADKASKQLALLGKPLDLKFTALDGTQVDLTKLRGKVVFLDFWATWCMPCMAKLPEILEINQKYKDKGLEMIGISLDEEKDELTKVVQEKKIPWPQEFDGKGWHNAVAQQFGVESIPAAWLVDKKGFVHEVDPDADVDAEIAKLLAAPAEEAKK